MRRQAPEAISLGTITQMVLRTQNIQLSQTQKAAVEMFIVAFATMSRLGEIARLTVQDVEEDGTRILIRPKKKWNLGDKLSKGVADGFGLYPTTILKVRRSIGIRAKREYIFARTEDKDEPFSTSLVTNTLARLGEVLGLPIRITAHSARKGAASEAIVRNVPPLVVKSLGGWQQIDSMEAYIGDTVRTKFPVLRALAGL